MKVLLTGANGQLGCCIQDVFPENWQLIATDKSILNIADEDAVKQFIQTQRPDVVVNAAAYTAVDKAEVELELAEKINAYGPYYLAKWTSAIGAKFFHVSTDYVFDGNKKTPYLVTDKTNPLGVYGQTKLEGEQLSLQVNPNSTIIRTSWVFSEYGNNFVKTMLRLAKQRPELKIVNDQIGCPTYAGDIANCIIKMIQTDAEPKIYHYCGKETMSWFDFAKAIIEIAYQQGYLRAKPDIIAITEKEYPTPARRPKYSVLDRKQIEVLNLSEMSLASTLNRIFPEIMSKLSD